MFFQTNRERLKENRIIELEDSDGNVKNSQEDTGDICFNVYSNLYKAREHDNNHDSAREWTFRGINHTLTQAMKNYLNKPMTLIELTNAIEAMAKGKAPGLDGLLTEFYLCLWPCIGPEFLIMVQKSLEKRKLSKRCD